MFTTAQWLGFIRHVLTGVGGLLIAAGWLEAGTAEQLIGGAMTVIGFIWSWAAKSPSLPGVK